MGKFRNPILFADYSDPDVIRVGDTFYLTASSFNYTPGLPILVSKDLVNWKMVNYAIDNIKEDRYKIPRHSEGVWAPSIRFHEGEFYIYYGMPDEGIYVVKTKDPLGKWEEPVCVLAGKGLIDSCPFWDEDGRAYIIHGYAKSRIGFKSILGIFEMNAEGTKAISEDHFIFDGNDPAHPAVTIEGPKVYKRNGYYYILAPAGGVKDGYQVALRSRDIHGPYEIKTVMHTGNTIINGPHQGGLVDTVNGDEWFIHFQDRGLYGRICHLQPVTWQNDWPVIGINPDENGCGEPVYEMEKPNTGVSDVTCYLDASDDFKDGQIGLQWQWLGNHEDAFCDNVYVTNCLSSIVKNDEQNEATVQDGIRLNSLNPSKDEAPTIWRSANVLTQKLIYPCFEAEIKMDATGLKDGDRAGVCMTGGQYVSAFIERISENQYLVKVIHSEGGDKDKIEVTNNVLELGELTGNELDSVRWFMTFKHPDIDVHSEDLYFANVHEPLKGQNPVLKISVKIGNRISQDLGVNYTPSDHTWVGAKLGIYALTKGKKDKGGFADFKYVHIREA
ncbi:MAG: glycoside hydrolase 43 family protein [Butyrivibrio sp.]|nr:glycoside hydrolase 43 family protein [Butyrivibrio sp.]